MKHMMAARVAKIGHKFKATHIVFLQKDNSDPNHFIPQIYDVHTRLQSAKELEASYKVDIPTDVKAR